MLPASTPSRVLFATANRSGGTQLLSRNSGSWGESPHGQWRSATSFSASPTANPVGARKRKGWFVVFESCDGLLAPTRSYLHPVLRCHGRAGRCCRRFGRLWTRRWYHVPANHHHAYGDHTGDDDQAASQVDHKVHSGF